MPIPKQDQTEDPQDALTIEKTKFIQAYTDNCILLYCTVPLFQTYSDLNKSYGTHARETMGVTTFFPSPDCSLVVSMHPEGPATGHFYTGFLGFRLSLSEC
jgi:hypothetical protein